MYAPPRRGVNWQGKAAPTRLTAFGSDGEASVDMGVVDEVSASVSLRLGAGPNRLDLDLTILGGPLRYVGREGPDELDCFGANQVGPDATKLQLGDGSNSVVCTSSQFLGDVTVVGGRDDDTVNFANLKGVLLAFGRHLFGPRTELRFRANHFPFTEPSAELDYSCPLCGGKGCKMCSFTGWVEWGGCGMIHPHVLERCGIDTERFQGFAFGMGIDRTAIATYGIPHLRHIFEGDVRVLEQI